MSEHTLGVNVSSELTPYGTPVEGTVLPPVRSISNSEVACWNTCQRKYYYEFDRNLTPVSGSGALAKGTLLHEILAVYYTVLKERTVNVDNNLVPVDTNVGPIALHHAAIGEARRRLMAYMTGPVNGVSVPIDTVMHVDKMLKGYWDYYKGDSDWEILEVETGYDLSITEQYQYSLRLDLLVRIISTGAIVLVDHKTAYNFWSQDDMDFSPQFPKYVGALRGNGIPVDYCILNQIRTRVLKNPEYTDMYRREVYKPSREKVSEMMREQIITSNQIVRHRSLPLEVRSNNVTRVLNKQVCSWCNSKDLCLSELNGADVKAMIENEYRQNDYGYNRPEIGEL